MLIFIVGDIWNCYNVGMKKKIRHIFGGKCMNKKERKLTSAEQKRKVDFENIFIEMEQKGYLKKDLSFSILYANIMGVIIMLPFIVIAFVVYFFVNPRSRWSFSLFSGIIFLIALLLLLILHEIIHGLTWGFFTKGHWSAISFGIIWKLLTPYCTCAEPLKKTQYIVGAVMPTLILGFGLIGIATNWGNYTLFVLSLCMIFGGGGDFLIILKLLRYRCQNKTVLFYDHPYECGFIIFEKA